MATRVHDLSALGFSVDGAEVEPGPYRLTVHRIVGGVFTADADAVRELLPSAHLHPLRFLPGRTLVMVNCTDADHHIGALPAFRCASMLVAAVVTPGIRPGPWVTPIISDRSTERHRTGLVVLASTATHRLATEFNRAVLGWPGFVADIRNEQHPELERFVATDGGEMIVEVSIRPTGKPEDWHPTLWAYGSRSGRVLGWRMDMSATTTQLRYGPGASQMALGNHPALSHLRSLDLQPRGVIGSFHTDGVRSIDTPPFDVGPTLAPPIDPAAPDEVEGRYVVVRADGTEHTVDAQPGTPEIDPAGNFVAAAIKGSDTGEGRSISRDESRDQMRLVEPLRHLMDGTRRLMSTGHVWLYRKTRGRFVSMGNTVVLVTTIGAKTGERRTNPLVAFPHGDGGWMVAAAVGGSRNPGWYHNMVANPEVLLEKGADRRWMFAREATGDERTRLWSELTEAEPAFASFQRKTERVIPVMVLEPTRPPSAEDDDD